MRHRHPVKRYRIEPSKHGWLYMKNSSSSHKRFQVSIIPEVRSLWCHDDRPLCHRARRLCDFEFLVEFSFCYTANVRRATEKNNFKFPLVHPFLINFSLRRKKEEQFSTCSYLKLQACTCCFLDCTYSWRPAEQIHSKQTTASNRWKRGRKKLSREAGHCLFKPFWNQSLEETIG